MFEWRGDRVDYTEALLSPPEGWTFERAVATTCSLDLATLLAVLLPLAFGESPDAPEAHRDGLLLLRALRRVAPRLTVFHQAGQIPVPKRHSALMPLLDRILLPVAMPKRREIGWPSFHPKTWTLEYRDEGGKTHFRFVALGRNLTGDDSRGVAVALESGGDRRKTRGTTPLRVFGFSGTPGATGACPRPGTRGPDNGDGEGVGVASAGSGLPMRRRVRHATGESFRGCPAFGQGCRGTRPISPPGGRG